MLLVYALLVCVHISACSAILFLPFMPCSDLNQEFLRKNLIANIPPQANAKRCISKICDFCKAKKRQ